MSRKASRRKSKKPSKGSKKGSKKTYKKNSKRISRKKLVGGGPDDPVGPVDPVDPCIIFMSKLNKINFMRHYIDLIEYSTGRYGTKMSVVKSIIFERIISDTDYQQLIDIKRIAHNIRYSITDDDVNKENITTSKDNNVPIKKQYKDLPPVTSYNKLGANFPSFFIAEICGIKFLFCIPGQWREEFYYDVYKEPYKLGSSVYVCNVKMTVLEHVTDYDYTEFADYFKKKNPEEIKIKIKEDTNKKDRMTTNDKKIIDLGKIYGFKVSNNNKILNKESYMYIRLIDSPLSDNDIEKFKKKFFLPKTTFIIEKSDTYRCLVEIGKNNEIKTYLCEISCRCIGLVNEGIISTKTVYSLYDLKDDTSKNGKPDFLKEIKPEIKIKILGYSLPYNQILPLDPSFPLPLFFHIKDR